MEGGKERERKGVEEERVGREGPQGVHYSQEGRNPFVLRLSPLEP